MKAPTCLRSLLCVPLFLAVPIASGANGTWISADGDSAEGDGNWSDTSRWVDGIVADSSGSTLTLQTPTGSVAREPNNLVGGYVINVDSDYTLQNITLAAGTWSNTKAYRITGAGELAFAGSLTPTITSVSSIATILEISPASVSGDQGITFGGSGLVYWNPRATSLTGTFLIGGGSVVISRAETLGNTTLRMSGGGPRLWVAPGAEGMEIGNAITLAVNGAAQSGGLSWYSLSSGIVTVSGDIGQANASFASNFSYGSGTGQGQQRFIVSGDNSYKGNTVIGGAGAVLVLAKSNTALGSEESTAEVSLANASAGLGLSGNITVTGKNLTLNGSGYGGIGFDGVEWAGSLFNQSGANQWDGEIKLGAAANPRIGVATGSRLLISGEISGSATGGLQKAGGGILELAAGNTYSTGTVVGNGTLLVSHQTALGTGLVKVGNDATLSINTGVVSQISTLELEAGAQLTFSLNGSVNATGITLSGNQVGNGTYGINILSGGGLAAGSYTLLTVAGTAAAANFQLTSIVDGYQGDLAWNNGVLTLNVTVVPEPRAMLLLGGSVLAGCLLKMKLR